MHPTFHVNRLSPWKGNEVNGLLPPPPEPIEVEGEEEYEVDEIRDSRMYRRQLQYLVRWKGYGEAGNSWEPAKFLQNAPDKVREFHLSNPNAPRRMAASFFDSILWVPVENHTEGSSTDLDWEEGKLIGRTARCPPGRWPLGGG